MSTTPLTIQANNNNTYNTSKQQHLQYKQTTFCPFPTL